jgi:DNA-binding NtrC family response regulator
VIVHGLVIDAPTLPEHAPRCVPLVEEWSVVGRLSASDVVLEHASISRKHARLRIEEGRLLVEDLGSGNGTHVRRHDGTEQRLDAHRPYLLAERESLRIGPFLLVPGESAGEGVLLGDSSQHEPPPGLESADPGSTESSYDRRAATDGARALSQVLRRPYRGDPWKWVVEGARELSRGKRAFLFASLGERLSLEASVGVDAPICLSQRFLELTRSSRLPWSLVTGSGLPPDAETSSLREIAPALRMTGLPFRMDGEVLAVACVEGAPAPAPDIDALAGFVQATVPLLRLALDLDLEVRRREALETVALRGAGEGRSAPIDTRRGLVGRSPAFLEAVATIERAAAAKSTVIIRGPSGSGKEGLARLLHEAGARRDQPFYAINAAAIPESLIEAALFGYDRGAFTGAERQSAGAFETADGGTLFLDEIGDLALAAQAKILRAIETGEITRIGGTRRRVDVRLVTATHRDLERMVEEGSFRRDLFYRVRVIEVVLPPLADRREDVLDLAEHFLHEFRRADGQRMTGPSPAAARALTGYAWPGNIRELRNVIERASVIDQDGVLDLDDLPPEVRRESAGSAAGDLDPLRFGAHWPEARKRFERAYFERALERHDGKVAETAQAIGVDRRTVSEKIREHRLKR